MIQSGKFRENECILSSWLDFRIEFSVESKFFSKITRMWLINLIKEDKTYFTLINLSIVKRR